jgi:hypothetical protein
MGSEDAKQHGQADRGQHAAAHALQYAEDDELADILSNTAERRRDDEHDQRGKEHSARSEAIAQPG